MVAHSVDRNPMQSLVLRIDNRINVLGCLNRIGTKARFKRESVSLDYYVFGIIMVFVLIMLLYGWLPY
jgi:hypothetical protein